MKRTKPNQGLTRASQSVTINSTLTVSQKKPQTRERFFLGRRQFAESLGKLFFFCVPGKIVLLHSDFWAFHGRWMRLWQLDHIRHSARQTRNARAVGWLPKADPWSWEKVSHELPKILTAHRQKLYQHWQTWTRWVNHWSCHCVSVCVCVSIVQCSALEYVYFTQCIVHIPRYVTCGVVLF